MGARAARDDKQPVICAKIFNLEPVVQSQQASILFLWALQPRYRH
jgi:hypothetical protein